jgi:predicted nucleic acid-binding protein
MSNGDCMAKNNEAVFDAGPFIHLHEIESLKLTKLFSEILTTFQILQECRRMLEVLKTYKNIVQKDLNPESKDFAKYLLERYNLDLGEATGIALCKQENIRLFFTDDLLARDTARSLGFQPHGTIAILLRAYRKKVVSKKEVKESIEKLYHQSSLFFTKDLRDWTLKEIEKYPK